MSGLCCPDLNFTTMSTALDILLSTSTGKPHLCQCFDDQITSLMASGLCESVSLSSTTEKHSPCHLEIMSLNFNAATASWKDVAAGAGVPRHRGSMWWPSPSLVGSCHMMWERYLVDESIMSCWSTSDMAGCLILTFYGFSYEGMAVNPVIPAIIYFSTD